MFNNCSYWQNITYFILPFSMFLLSLRQNIIIMSTIIGRKHEIKATHCLYLQRATSSCGIVLTEKEQASIISSSTTSACFG